MAGLFAAPSVLGLLASTVGSIVASKVFGGGGGDSPPPAPPPPPPPVTPPTVMPVADDEAAKKKRAMQLSASRASRGRQSTILSNDTSGDFLGG